MFRPPQHDDPRRGQALVEFALTLPILLMLVFGVIDLARIMFAYTQVVDASRQAIRYGIVEGLDAPRDQYFDCDAIRDKALQLSGVITVEAAVEIRYSWDGDGGTPYECNPDVPSSWPTWVDFQNTDGTMPQVVMEVDVTGWVRPLTPVILPFASNIRVNYTSTRTIVFQSASYTEEWVQAPPKPRNFAALVNCSNGFVDFYWSPIITVPANNLSRLEIRTASATGHTIVATPDPAFAFCTHANGCSTVTIPTSGSSAKGSYYLVAFVDHPPLEQASSPSDTAVVACPTTGGSTGAIMGTVWHDADGDGYPNEGVGLAGVDVWLTYWGPDGVYGTADDSPKVIVTTAADGTYVFGGLTIGRPYVIEVDELDPQLAGTPNATTDNPRVVAVPSSTPVNSINFGYWLAP